MMIEILKPDFRFKNDSGLLVQLVRDEWKQVNVISSAKGSVRGGHYHKYNKEAFYLIKGAFDLDVWNKEGVHERYYFKSGDMFMIKEYISHTFAYTEDTVLVSLYSQGVELDNDSKDIWDSYE